MRIPTQVLLLAWIFNQCPYVIQETGCIPWNKKNDRCHVYLNVFNLVPVIYSTEEDRRGPNISSKQKIHYFKKMSILLCNSLLFITWYYNFFNSLCLQRGSSHGFYKFFVTNSSDHLIIGVSIVRITSVFPSGKTDRRHCMMHPCNVTVRRPIN